jgi:hypothetical protein
MDYYKREEKGRGTKGFRGPEFGVRKKKEKEKVEPLINADERDLRKEGSAGVGCAGVLGLKQTPRVPCTEFFPLCMKSCSLVRSLQIAFSKIALVT